METLFSCGEKKSEKVEETSGEVEETSGEESASEDTLHELENIPENSGVINRIPLNGENNGETHNTHVVTSLTIKRSAALFSIDKVFDGNFGYTYQMIEDLMEYFMHDITPATSKREFINSLGYKSCLVLKHVQGKCMSDNTKEEQDQDISSALVNFCFGIATMMFPQKGVCLGCFLRYNDVLKKYPISEYYYVPLFVIALSNTYDSLLTVCFSLQIYTTLMFSNSFLLCLSILAWSHANIEGELQSI